MKHLKNLRFSTPVGERGSWWQLAYQDRLREDQPACDNLMLYIFGQNTWLSRSHNVRLFS